MEQIRPGRVEKCIYSTFACRDMIICLLPDKLVPFCAFSCLFVSSHLKVRLGIHTLGGLVAVQ
jgi:hypothetical protein